jgi:tRNA U34 5-carboxymethylaminomethyl modifying enzyme MnmG/GidA
LRREARERLSLARPTTLEQAEALPGVTPADLAVLEAWLCRR